MYDKSRVSKLTHFVYFVLKFIERLSSEKDFWKYNCKITFEWHMCLYHVWQGEKKLEEMKHSRPECSYLEDTFR